MSAVEYRVQFLHEDGTWRTTLAATDPDQMRTPAGVLEVLAKVRGKFPDDTWRVVSRVVPDWTPADEDALRGGCSCRSGTFDSCADHPPRKTCPVCLHPAGMHGPDGCWWTMSLARPDALMGCPCGMRRDDDPEVTP